VGEPENNGLMTVGVFARRAGVSVRTVQYYDLKGLLSPTTKDGNNLRLYSEEDLGCLYRILTLKYLGYSLAEIKAGEGQDDIEELNEALGRRMGELEKESVNILRNITTVQSLQMQLDTSREVDWAHFASQIDEIKNHEDVLWNAMVGDSVEGQPVPGLSREQIMQWHRLMGDTIEVMHAGAAVTDERAQALAIRYEKLGGMTSAMAGLKRLENQRDVGPKEYGRDFYAGLQRRTLSYLQDALDALGNGNESFNDDCAESSGAR